MGLVYGPGRHGSYCSVGIGTLHHSVPVFLFGLLLLASLSVVSAARPVRYTLPRFLDTPNNITAVVGSDVLLPCSVANLGTKSVIWKKVTQYNPITIGDYIFAPESRYYIVHEDPYMTQEQYQRYEEGEVNPRWNLKISNVALTDAGTYECQISTKEDIMRAVTLHVVEDKSHRKLKKTGIKLSGTDFVEKGSTIDLNCTATSIDYRPKGVDWFKDGSRIKVGARTLINEYLDSTTNILHSRLMVRRAQMEDAGTYVCRFSQSHVESIKVIVLNTDSHNRRRGTDPEVVGTHPDRGGGQGVGYQAPYPSQPSKSKGGQERTRGWEKQRRTNDGQGGKGSCVLPTSHLHLWCFFVLIVITKLFRTST